MIPVGVFGFLVLLGSLLPDEEPAASPAEPVAAVSDPALFSESASTSTRETDVSAEERLAAEVAEEAEEAERAAEEEAANFGTVSQENALQSAEDYLAFSASSRSGLIDQLESEGFSQEKAANVVDDMSVDYNEQAAKSARGYLDASSFSRSGLIDQLEFEGYTRQQAEYGVEQTGL